jgi:prepilin-type N-terminal cleavage/methylation domain-containing protein
MLNYSHMKKTNFKSGFTLIELMVAITIIAIMASVAIFGLPSVSQKGQDTQRLAGFRELELAIAGYKNINGKYPDAGSGTDYIVGLTPGYMQRLPQDTAQGNGNGFIYAVSADKKSYCLAVKNTVYKNATQPELVWGEKSWKACKGNTDMTGSL